MKYGGNKISKIQLVLDKLLDSVTISESTSSTKWARIFHISHQGVFEILSRNSSPLPARGVTLPP
jgi:hypothetical protein